MQLINFSYNNKITVGTVTPNGVVDLAKIGGDPELTMEKILQGGKRTILELAQLVLQTKDFIPLDTITYCKPIISPGKIIGVGLNYHDHTLETNSELPKFPVLFARFNSSLVAHQQNIIRSQASSKFDYEGELAVIIGKRAKQVKEIEAQDYIGGYTIFNDVTVRDYQGRSSQWLIGKNFDSSGAIGPCVVTPDSLPKLAQNLIIETRLNNEIVQRENSSNMIFNIAKLIETITEAITLEPGDIIATGTPAGVGYKRTPPLYLQPGDLCEITIEGIGTLSNRITQTT
jgi:2-keto-4-pentenoate hydratase/2-oxohepta-3-ene-1,7-dioic acid hydratase in catechol pathway